VTGGLGLEGGDADALAYELVHQRRFTHVGVAYDIYKPTIEKIATKMKSKLSTGAARLS
jgi:hypothetical protein